MSKKLQKIVLVLIVVFGLFSFTIINFSKQSYKSVIQLKNYDGEGAYVVVSLINPDGKYNSTLSMMGEDPSWYDYFDSWYNFYKKNAEDVDAISGESILGGERKQITFRIDNSLLDKGYKIRFETAVEDQKYYEKDAELEFSSENLGKKIEGKGYIRYVHVAN